MVCTILVDTLGMRKMCAKMVPRLLTEEQKAQRLNACQDILQQMEADKKLLETVITGDEFEFFNMIQKQNDRVVSGKVCPHPDQRKPACNVQSERDADHLL